MSFLRRTITFLSFLRAAVSGCFACCFRAFSYNLNNQRECSDALELQRPTHLPHNKCCGWIMLFPLRLRRNVACTHTTLLTCQVTPTWQPTLCHQTQPTIIYISGCVNNERERATRGLHQRRSTQLRNILLLGFGRNVTLNSSLIIVTIKKDCSKMYINRMLLCKRRTKRTPPSHKRDRFSSALRRIHTRVA